jgi:serine/threonine protein kinase
VKPGNLLITSDGIIKYADFGLAKTYLKDDPTKEYTTGVVTRYYRPPEILFGAKHYDPSVDIWSAGCILGELLLRKPLFPGTTDID